MDPSPRLGMLAGDHQLYCVSSLAYLGLSLCCLPLSHNYCLISILFSFQPIAFTFPHILLSILQGQVGCGSFWLGLNLETHRSLSLKCFSQDPSICHSPPSERNQGKPRANYFLFSQGEMKSRYSNSCIFFFSDLKTI